MPAMSLLRQGTYSIVARDPDSGELGVAVQSHWFAVGALVPWALPGVGAVATQANVNVAYGSRGLELLASGASAPQALARLVAEDPFSASRQLAIVDATGAVATHTGAECIAAAGHATGEAVSCQANIMGDERVWPAMLAAYRAAASEPLGERLMRALEAAEAAGGDIRGRQSAAMLIVPAQGESFEATLSLRVDDHEDPLGELRRLLALHGAYRLASEGDERVAAGEHQAAARLYEAASALAPGNHELLFWAGLGAAQAGELEEGVARVRTAIGMHAGWRELLRRLPADVAPAAGAVRERLGGPH
jgi:uncharacterized Ntn-hydrolase superfamily protein